MEYIEKTQNGRKYKKGEKIKTRKPMTLHLDKETSITFEIGTEFIIVEVLEYAYNIKTEKFCGTILILDAKMAEYFEDLKVNKEGRSEICK